MSNATDRILDAAFDCNLTSDEDNEHSATTSGCMWFWGALADCRRLAAVLGVDIVSDKGSDSVDADLYKNGQWVGMTYRNVLGRKNGAAIRISTSAA